MNRPVTSSAPRQTTGHSLLSRMGQEEELNSFYDLWSLLRAPTGLKTMIMNGAKVWTES